jgi:hypothetical protein
MVARKPLMEARAILRISKFVGKQPMVSAIDSNKTILFLPNAQQLRDLPLLLAFSGTQRERARELVVR